MLERALQVMTQVLIALERQGHSVEVSEQGRTTAIINGEHVSFGIEEPIRKVVTQKPRVPNPSDRWDYDQIVTYEHSGKLVLVIHASTWGDSAAPADDIEGTGRNQCGDIFQPLCGPTRLRSKSRAESSGIRLAFPKAH
jgi:hypothetical protein